MSWTPWKLDLLVAVAIAGVILIAEPGVAIGALLAVLILGVCGLSLMPHLRRRHRRRGSRSR